MLAGEANMVTSVVSEPAYITPRGMAKIEEELIYLKTVRRLDVIERLQDAKIGGDGLDNTEYIAVQEELSLLEGRIQDLEYILRHAELIQPGTVDGIIRLGSVVVVQEEGTEVLETYTLTGPAEADPSEGLISDQSPLGCALLNHTIGDDVEVKAPSGLLRFRILAVN
jgi:transcription elongation factor GreA